MIYAEHPGTVIMNEGYCFCKCDLPRRPNKYYDDSNVKYRISNPNNHYDVLDSNDKYIATIMVDEDPVSQVSYEGNRLYLRAKEVLKFLLMNRNLLGNHILLF